MEYRHQYDEIMKLFGEGRLKEAGAIQKDLQLHKVNIASHYYAVLYVMFCQGRDEECEYTNTRSISIFMPL